MHPEHMSLLEIVWGLDTFAILLLVTRRMLYWLIGIDQVIARLDDLILISQGKPVPIRRSLSARAIGAGTRIRNWISVRIRLH